MLLAGMATEGVPMPSAEEVANAIGYDFLRRGNFLTGTANAAGEDIAMAFSVDEAIDEVSPPERAPFASLAVEAVGFEEGPTNPSVHVYLTRGTLRLIRELPQEISGVPIAVHKMGPISVRPDTANASTNQGHLFERGGRICCGSSCGPTSESGAGTIGALVKIVGSEEIYLLSNNHVLGGCNRVPKGQPILSPAAGDGRPGIRAPGEVVRHFAIQELRSGSLHFVDPSEMDAALAQATNSAILSSWQGDASGYDTPTQTHTPTSQMRVQKF